MPKATLSVSNAPAKQSPNNQLQSGAVPYYDSLWDMVWGRPSHQPAPRVPT